MTKKVLAAKEAAGAVIVMFAAVFVGGFLVGQVAGGLTWRIGRTEAVSVPAAPEAPPADEGALEPVAPEPPLVTVEVPTKANIAGKKLVALTFDDGPSRATTPRLLDILKEKNVKATFFVVGQMARSAPEVARREVTEGHEIGSHTTAHGNLSQMIAATVRSETEVMTAIIAESGYKAALMRPPYGAFNETTKANIGMPMIYWSVDPMDWKYRNAATVRQNVVTKTFDGAIILLHDIHATTVDAVAAIIDDLRAQGYEFLTVSQLAAARGVTMMAGGVYGSFRP